MLGKGRVELLERIGASGSLAQAARDMEMSYRQAWQMVKEMNERSGSPVVVMSKGGKQGGGTQLTDAGEGSIRVYREMEARFQAFVDGELEILNASNKSPQP